MQAVLRYRHWDLLETIALSCLLAFPPLAIYSWITAAPAVWHTLILMILVWMALTFGLTATRWGARAVVVQAGLCGLIIIWLAWSLLAGAPVTSLILHALLSVGLIFLIRQAQGSAESSTLGSLGISVIVGVVLIYWLALLLPQQALLRLEGSLWVTTISILSALGAGLLLWQPYLAALSRQFAWTLLVTLAWVIPFLRMSDNPNGAWTLSLEDWLFAIAGTVGVFAIRFFAERVAVPTLCVRPRLFRLRLEAGNRFFNQNEFQRARVHYDEALWAWPDEENGTYYSTSALYLDTAIKWAYALDQSGRRGEAVLVAKDLATPLISGFRRDEPRWQEIVLALLLVSKQFDRLFQPGYDDPHPIWKALGSPHRNLRSLARQVTREAVPGSFPTLVQGFQKGDIATQKTMLSTLQELGGVKYLVNQDEIHTLLLDALDASDRELGSITLQILQDSKTDAVSLWLKGLDHESRQVRRLALQHLRSLDRLPDVSEQLTRRVSTIAALIAIAVSRTLLDQPPAQRWSALADEIVNYGNPHGLDALAELQGTQRGGEAATLIWEALYDPLFYRLLIVMWSRQLGEARQAAGLAQRFGPDFLAQLVARLESETYQVQRRTANLLARLALLVADGAQAQVETGRQLSSGDTGTFVQLTLSGKPGGTYELPIPVVHLPARRPMLLLINGEQYKLSVKLSMMSSDLPLRLHFIVRTNDIRVVPSLHDVMDRSHRESDTSKDFGLDLTRNDQRAFADRLTVRMMSNGRGQRLMAYPVFVCDSFVLNGLKS